MKEFADLYWYGLDNYFNFSGRACRKEFIAFIVMIFLIAINIAAFQGILLGINEMFPDIAFLDNTISVLKVLNKLFIFAMLIPAYAAGARRLHDINITGWLQLISVIPVIGNITLFVLLFFIKGNEKDNKYGKPSENYKK